MTEVTIAGNVHMLTEGKQETEQFRRMASENRKKVKENMQWEVQSNLENFVMANSPEVDQKELQKQIQS